MTRSSRPEAAKPSPRGKKRVLLWTSRALFDLEAIGDYIARDKPDTAERWVAALIAAADRAASLPQAGRAVPELRREDIRELIKGSYRIVYRVMETRIEVLTVFEGHRMFPRAIKKNLLPP